MCNSSFSRIFMCLCIILISISNLTVINGEVDVNSPDVDDAALNEMSFKDKYNLHHAFVIEKLKWKSGMISFKIDKAFSDHEIFKILIAMFEVENFSCIRFVAHDQSHGPSYVMIKKHNDDKLCDSEVGFLDKGEQILNLGAQCVEISTIIHELLHTIGFEHHQQRSDRDKYIAIHTENVITDQAFNFNRKTNYDKRISYLTPFDFTSIMLYNEYEFSKNKKSVITPKVIGVEMPQFYNLLSKYDRILLNRFYNCKSIAKKKSTIFYENENDDRLAFPPIINYHEIARAKEYLLDNDESMEFKTEEAEENEKTDEELGYGQEEKSIATGQTEENQKTNDELRDEHLIDENEEGKIDQENKNHESTNFI